jgi:hypothetical protein
VALRIPLGDEEPAALAALLRDLLAHPERLREMGAAAREMVRTRHAPERSAAAVVEACLEWRDLDPPGDAVPDEAAPSSAASRWLEGEIAVEGADLPWPEGERRRLRIHVRNRGFSRWLAGERGTGGIAVAVQLVAAGRDLLAGRPWLPLPRDLPPGGEAVLETEVRRPPGPPGSVELIIEPHLFGGTGLSHLGGPLWQRAL